MSLAKDVTRRARDSREQSNINQATHDSNESKGRGKRKCCAAVNHTNTTRSYISSHHDGTLSCLEFVQDPVTLVLLFVTVDCCDSLA